MSESIGSRHAADSYKEIEILRKELIEKHEDSLANSKLTIAKMCDWAVERLDKAEVEIMKYEDHYTDRIKKGDEKNAKSYEKKIVDTKNTAYKSCHLDLIFTESQLRSMGINDVKPDEAKAKLDKAREQRQQKPAEKSAPADPESNVDKKQVDESDVDHDPFHYRNKYHGGDADVAGKHTETDKTETKPQVAMVVVARRPSQMTDKGTNMFDETTAADAPAPNDTENHVKQVSPIPPATQVSQAVNKDPIPCTYCAEQNIEFNESRKLNKHYALFCPMLRRCEHCNRVVEIRLLHDHNGGKCPVLKGALKECAKCGCPCNEQQLDAHKKDVGCAGTKPKEGHAWCPLCNEAVHDTETVIRVEQNILNHC